MHGQNFPCSLCIVPMIAFGNAMSELRIRIPMNPLDQRMIFVYDVYHVILIPASGKASGKSGRV